MADIKGNDNKNTAQSLFDDAETLLDNGKYEKALTAVQNGLSLDSNSFIGIWLRAQIYFYGDNYEECIRDFEAVIEICEQKAHLDKEYYEWFTASAYETIGSAYGRCWDSTHDQSSLLLAARSFQIALRFDNSRHFSWYCLGLIQRRLKKYDDAVTSIRAAIDLGPTGLESHSELVKIELMRFRLPAAWRAFREALMLAPLQSLYYK
jgi:tetratricopeptide (TPR) repeat protein